MPTYHLLVFADGRTFTSDFRAKDDDAALDVAARICTGCDVEIWEDGRFIAQLSPIGQKVERPQVPKRIPSQPQPE